MGPLLLLVGLVALTGLLALRLYREGDVVQAHDSPVFGQHVGTLSFGLVVLGIGDVLAAALLFSGFRDRNGKG